MSTEEQRKFDSPIQLRFDATMLGDIEAHAEKMRRATPAIQISRSDAVRDLVLRGLKDAGRAR